MSNQWPPPQGGGQYGGWPPYQQQPRRPRPYGQQPYGQQPYGHYPRQEPYRQQLFQQRSRPGRDGGGGATKVLLVLAGAGLLVVAMVVGVIVLFGAGGGAGASPDEALDTFVSGIRHADCDAIEDVTTDAFHDEMNMDSCDSSTFERGIATGSGDHVELAAGDVEQDGDKATGTVEIDGAEGFDVELVEDGDGWKVDAFSIQTSDAAKL